jgi:hypothetical protein
METQLKENNFIFFHFYIANFKRLLLKYKLIRKYYLLMVLYQLFDITLIHLNMHKTKMSFYLRN